MIQLNEIKSKVQAEAKAALNKAGGSGIVAIATGGGKSKIPIDYIVEHRPERILLVVPTVKLRDVNWRNEFSKWGHLELFNKIEKSCYASIKNLKGRHYDLIILDELQNITDLNFTFFDNNSVSKIVALTATPPVENEKKLLIQKLKLKVVYHIPIDKAVEIGLIAPYQLYLVEIMLNDTVKYIKAGSKDKPFMTTEKKQYDYLTGKITKAMYSDNKSALKWLYLQRMHFIYGLQSKRNAAKYILKSMISDEDRTMIFTAKIEIAEFLEPKTYHSKSGDKDLDDFMKGKINRLSCVRALNEGMDIENLDTAMIQQLTSKERHLIQRIGRIVRYRENHLAKIFILYVKDTVDEKWMINATKNIDISNAIIKRLVTK